MILITTALYCEAQPFIRYFQLKKDMSFTRFQVFRNDDILLLITGTGSMQAAIAASSVCSLIPPSRQDLFLNIGVCGLSKNSSPAGSVFLGNKIVELSTGRSFYPDLIYSHPFLEGTILTSPSIVCKTADGTGFGLGSYKTEDYFGKAYLIDMEAAGFYQASSCFYRPHQLFFIKIVSDFLDASNITPEAITELIMSKVPQITGWIKGLHKEMRIYRGFFTAKEEDYIIKLSEGLQLSASLELQLRQLLKYVKLQEGSFMVTLDLFFQNQTLPCKTKTEGKKYLEQIKQLFV